MRRRALLAASQPSGGENLFTFYIYDPLWNLTEKYQAEMGMTWGEWVNSEYNIGNYIVDELDSSIAKFDEGIPIGWVGDDYGYIYSSDVITQKEYILIN